MAKNTATVTAESMAAGQREISVSEFFAKNRHLLGFDNPQKALLMTVKEAVDNSLDACEEAGILPEITVTIQQTVEDRFRVIIEDNGPGIVKAQIPKIFGKLLYGSKFHSLRQSRGQQGIGISAAALYGQLTTGKPVSIISRTGKKKPAHFFRIHIDTNRNRPEVDLDKEIEWDKTHGTRVEIELEGRFQRGKRSVDNYLRQTVIANPHILLHYTAPDGEQTDYARSIRSLPEIPKAIKPHPHGIELGMLISLSKNSSCKNLKAFLQSDFSRVSSRAADEIINKAKLSARARLTSLKRDDFDALYRSINSTRLMSPPTNCISPIGKEGIIKGLKSVISADFYTAVTRPPSVYRGNPFIIEAGIAYGGDQPGDEPAELLRFANRVPLLYQQSGCAISTSVVSMSWKNYNLQQPKGALPLGPITIFVHMSSVWVPFTSESKEAIAHYPEIIKEIKLALQDCGRKVGVHIRKRKRELAEAEKRSYIQKYIPQIAVALEQILGFKKPQTEKTVKNLKTILERSRSG